MGKGIPSLSRRGRQAARQGAILLVVLAVVVLVLAMTTSWIAAIGPMHQESQRTGEHLLQAQMLTNGERLAQAWIKAHGAVAVSPERGGGWSVVDDYLPHPDGDLRLRVTVFDGWSGLPAPLLHVRGSLRRELPSILASLAIPPLPIQGEEALLGPQDLVETVEIPPGARRFPDVRQHGGFLVQWRAPGQGGSVTSDSSPAASTSDSEVVAFAISPHSDGRINLNTAPIRLVESVCRLRGIGVPEKLRSNRRRGLRTQAPDGAADGDPRLPRLVDQTLAWNCLISVTSIGRTRTWWVVMVGNSANLRIVQRHDADS